MSGKSPNAYQTNRATDDYRDALFALITEQLAQERLRKTWIEERGIGIVTTSAGLATLLFGLTAVSTGADGFRPTDQVRVLLAISAVVFLLAGLAGLAVAYPWPYRETDEDRLTGWLEETDRDERYHRQRAARARLSILRGWRSIDSKKVWIVFAGMALQTFALVLVAMAVVVVLLAPLPTPAPPGS